MNWFLLIIFINNLNILQVLFVKYIIKYYVSVDYLNISSAILLLFYFDTLQIFTNLSILYLLIHILRILYP